MNSMITYLKDTVRRFPDRIALTDAERSLTYRELDRLSDAVACALMRRLPAGARNVPVAVYLPKDARAVVAFLGILKSGNPYAPLDPQIPMQRMRLTLENLRPPLLITDADGRRRLLEEGIGSDDVLCDYGELAREASRPQELEERLALVTDVDPAYIMYTSGTTGVPKGVVIPHRGVENYARWIVREFHVTEDSVFGLQSGFHFDNSVFDLYGCLLTGARLVIIPEILFMYPTKLIPYMNEQKINIIFWVPTVMISVANSGVFEEALPEFLKTVVFAGEVMPNKQLNIWRRALPDCLYANLYGPTEITVDCLYYLVDRAFSDNEPLPIGRACPNTKILLLKEDGTPAAPREEGEICVVGVGVGLGYWNNPEQTQRAFVQNPLNPCYRETMYRTGDIGYQAEDGLIMYVGRKDSQFKLRGNRIELGEIEQHALAVPGVERACALFDSERQEIVVFVKAAAELSLRKFNLDLKKYVPKYMLPSRLFTVDEFPYNQNQKIDRLALKKEYLEKADE